MSIHNTPLFVALVGAALLFSSAMAVERELAASKIVLPENPNRVQQEGAAELAMHLELVCGKKPAAAEGGFEFVFAPPPDAAPAKDFESYFHVEGEKVYFWGDDAAEPRPERHGSLFAVYAFLNKCLGVDWAYPGKDGIVFVRRTRATLPDRLDDRYFPPLVKSLVRTNVKLSSVLNGEASVPPELRLGRQGVIRNVNECRLWSRRRRLQSRDTIPYGHAFLDWQDRFLKTHPEYLCQPSTNSTERGMRGRDGFKYGKLCVSNEGVVDQIVADWVKRGKPKYLNVCENDGRSYCRCAGCCALDSPHLPDRPFHAHMTDRYLNFWNRIAAKVVALRPDAVLSAYIYSDYRYPPHHEKVAYPDNMYFGIVPTLTDDYEADCTAWKRAGMKHFFLRPNFHCYHGVLPRGCERAIYENFQLSRKFGIVGVDYDGYPGRYTTRPEYYVAARMIVEPEGKFEDFMHDFCAAFGEAAPVAEAYFARIRGRGEKALARFRADRAAKRPSDGSFNRDMQIHTIAELEGDVAFLEASRKTVPSFRERECAARFDELLLRARHYVLTAKFYEASMNGTFAERERAGWELLEFRRANVDKLGDRYGTLFGGNFACGELWAWRNSRALRAALGDIRPDPDGIDVGWASTFDNGTIGWWQKREAFGGVATNGCGAAGSRGAVWLKADSRNVNGISMGESVVPGGKYRYSAAFRGEGGVKKGILRVLYGKGANGSDKKAEYKVFDVGPEWETRSIEFTVPDDLKTVNLYIFTGHGPAGSRLWCDDVSLKYLK